ncbi:methylated-DNA-[protein]-cysteine S-methyltransferase [Desulfocicer vacuolatum DSM 3385]|uniref:Methylated-DNA--protein-cysteine methyltransferase n=1 Tax=Desulfocicer vacuolatum DSM 3385 TaxID=1121400 RepID=A0A1W2CAN0_9BACT|nr:methylated-DNA--[protein]-cysteine S-methyltransferase [Desulfocicer vacuolatum]SMC82191.1 methylated-DNA-[protein]-cysteine S-methyltransferase [Desulfocicer vacuolatum DSM 3385]
MNYDIQNSIIGPILAGADHKGLRHIGFQKGARPMEVPGTWKLDKQFLKPIFDQVHAYLNGELKNFDLILAPAGSPFQKMVWSALLNIPYGKTVSYGDIATAIGSPKSCRAVGGANSKNPIPLIIPCHRVIGADGRLVGYGSGLFIKQKLLSLELEYHHTNF